MKFFKKVGSSINSRAFAYTSFVLSVCAAVFLSSATWTYGWIADLYPLGDKFVPTLLGVICACAAVNLIHLLIRAFAGDKKDSLKGIKAINVIHTIFALLGIVTFIYTFVLVFGLDSGISADAFYKGLNAISDKLLYLALAAGFGLAPVFCSNGKKALAALVSGVLICAVIISITMITNISDNSSQKNSFVQAQFTSSNAASGAQIVFETLKKDEKADAANILDDSNKCWTAQCPDGSPAEGVDNTTSSYAEIKLAAESTINTALIEEIGNQVQYFRIQAFIDGEWKTVYQSEKIQDMRLCSFDAVTTDRVRLSIDKFRDDAVPANIKSLKLYNEPKRNAEGFEVSAYQRLDGDVPTEILAKGDEYVRNYAKFYDVYSTVIVFAAVHWDENGNMNFGEMGEEKFAQELAALKEIIAKRQNQSHRVKLIVTALADGAWGDGHNGVNIYMASHWEKVADQITALVKKYDFDGVDIDWEYPASTDDWKVYDSFIQKLHRDLKAYKDDSIISSALSSGSLGLSKETFDCLDQVQFMAYDGNDTDGYQSSLQQAEEGLRDFEKNGADISKINIGIAVYGRPISGAPYWASWRTLESANYWDSKYYNVPDAGQIYDGTFCSPALAGDKTAYALLSGAGGVMVFRVGCDRLIDDPNSVTGGIEDTINRYVTGW